eukprot:TRINITY_DN9174_c0_g1_i3.p1 TRINITY_DN9174_c0_g1~~TRINITY_DN9174_c0_g1_i3.p1  ORF type:complete len:352 (+),score=24.65 TRINITY_DN9174_c0_g1_i3:72-1058(+)
MCIRDRYHTRRHWLKTANNLHLLNSKTEFPKLFFARKLTSNSNLIEVTKSLKALSKYKKRSDWPTISFSFQASKLRSSLIENIKAAIPSMKIPARQIRLNINWKNYPNFDNFINECNKLTDSLAQLSSLTQFFFDFYGSEFNDESCLAFVRLFNRCDRISHLTLGAQMTQLSDSGVALLCSSIASLTLLELHLNLRRLPITNAAVLSLSEVIGKLPTLTRVMLEFQENNDLTDEGCAKLTNSFKELHNFSHLTLCFYKCSRIGAKTLQNLSEAMLLSPPLSTLELYFGETSVTNESFTIFAKSVEKLAKLNKISVSVAKLSTFILFQF